MIFPTMRRGGRAVYAFDVSDPKTPKLMWRINADMSDYSGLGQTWSTPRVAPVKWSTGSGDPVLIMGGGYDNATEDQSPLTSNGGLGTGVYVINIRTGERLAWLPTDFSVPSDVSLIDTDGDGYVDRGYVADVRAQLYRIDIEPSTGAAVHPNKWKITKLAALNDDKDKTGVGGLDSTRKVFFGPDVVLTKKYVALMLGTGDREKPLTAKTNDRFYVIKDRNVAKGAPSVTVLTDASSALVPISDNPTLKDPDGCYLAMATNGEKVINQPVTFGGITYFSSNTPTPNVANKCSATQSKAYQLPLICRVPTVTPLVGDGLPPSPVVGYVDVDGKGTVVPFVIGGSNTKNSAIEASKAPINIRGNRKRSFWFMQNNDR
jgi:type IV pilus assembly protein PilY1